MTKAAIETPTIPLAYNSKNHLHTATQLVLAVKPEWRNGDPKYIDFVAFKDGMTNTLLQATFKRPSLTTEELEKDAVLLRAYGPGTEVLIDREKEVTSHSILANSGLAPTLLARFNNGLLYNFIPGTVSTPEIMRDPQVSCAIAKKLAEWHTRMPVSAVADIGNADGENNCASNGSALYTPAEPSPNVYDLLLKLHAAIPSQDNEEIDIRDPLLPELQWLKQGALNSTDYIGGRPYVFAHCDLTSENIIITSGADQMMNGGLVGDGCVKAPKANNGISVDFIDYEYACAAPAAFDIANHFAEWTGLDCDYNVIPTHSQRSQFLRHYLESFNKHIGTTSPDINTQITALMKQVDTFRGIPGLCWGMWALIQAETSNIDFDFRACALRCLGEYFDWKHSQDSVRERRWAQESA